MSRLFIHPYLDEDVDVLIARLVIHYGGIATTAVEAGQCGTSDAQQLEYAASHGMAILTHNREDFEKLASEYFTTGRSHAGIIIAVRRPAHDGSLIKFGNG